MSEAAFVIIAVGLGVPFYSYIVYPTLLFVLGMVVQAARDAKYLIKRAERRNTEKPRPFVSIIMSAFNEEDVLESTLEACTNVEYPSGRYEVIVGSDDSFDNTVDIAKRFEDRGVRVLEFHERRGKISVIKDCVEEARGDILVFTDANIRLEPEAVQNLVRHFVDPGVGAVCGELRLVRTDSGENREGLYWQYEVALKTLESRMHGVIGANGPLYALRKDVFPDVGKEVITDDFVIPMKVRDQDYKVNYDPEAVAREETSGSASDEFGRRIRIGAGNWQALWDCAGLLLPWKGFIAFSFFSHKVLRWLTPFCMLLALLANLTVLWHPVGQLVFAGQLLFYAAAGLGYVLQRWRLPAGPLKLFPYFLTINTALGIGFAKGVLGLQEPAWRRTERSAVPAGEKQGT